MSGHTEPVDNEPLEAVFYEISKDDEYSEVGELKVETHINDEDYPMSVTAVTEDGRDIGLTLSIKLIRRIVAEAWALGLI